MSDPICIQCRRRMSECYCAEIAEEHASARSNDSKRVGRVMRLREDNEPQRIVPCRDCGAPVELSEFAWQMAQRASDMLAKRGEPPLEDGELTRCPPCGHAWRKKQNASAEDDMRAVRAVMAEAKTKGALTQSEAAWLRKHGHGEFVDAFQRRQDAATRSKPKRNSRARQESVE